jgi:hypothetical protein
VSALALDAVADSGSEPSPAVRAAIANGQTMFVFLTPPL